ncbi:MAG TPA: hypothetical protein PKZ94_01785 [Candidatus Pacearchaeota archaeon]|nr:hypothetical protein [Candidatus Pacearchaeota archaeon]
MKKMKNFFKNYKHLKNYFVIFLGLLAFAPFFVRADDLGQSKNFLVEPDYSDFKTAKVNATLARASDKLYFYIDSAWLNSKTDKEKESIYFTLNNLGKEFDTIIYPQLTSIYGHEAIPGIDKDTRITALLYPMKENARGYVRTIDEYDKTVNPLSNQREMVYLNVDNLTNPLMKAFLAHEFMHLISFNQKNLTYGVSDDVWLTEARSEYAPALLGYDLDSGSGYLNNRLKTFIDNPSDSLTEWNNTSIDYGIVNIFTHYLVDQYGLSILVDSLKSKQTGIASLNYALAKSGSKDTFDDAFTNFTIAVYLNDCNFSSKYCFKNSDGLKDLRILPYSNFLPFTGASNLSLGQNIKNYSAQWQKFSGSAGNLKIVFKAPAGIKVRVPYIVKNVSGSYTVDFFNLDSNNSGELIISDINTQVASVILIPSIQIKDAKSQSAEYNYSITVTSFINNGNQDQSGNNNQNNSNTSNIKLPFSISKPLDQMNREELLTVLLRLLIYILLQGKPIPLT